MLLWQDRLTSVPIYILGAFLNVISLWLCCRKNNWQKTSNIKILIVTQGYSSLMVFACSLAMELFANLVPHPFCRLLPTIFVFVLSFAWVNLAVLLVVKHAELTSIWRLRFKMALLIIFTELVVCTAIEFPILYSATLGSPIVSYKDGDFPRCSTQTSQEQVPFMGMKFNVVSYLFCFILFLHFGIVGSLILNRLIAIAMHLSLKESDDDQMPRQRCYNTTLKHAMNALCIILVSVFIIVLLVRLEKEVETLNYLNYIFHKMRIVSVSVLCGPVHYLFSVQINTTKSSNNLDEKTILSNNKDDLQGKC